MTLKIRFWTVSEASKQPTNPAVDCFWRPCVGDEGRQVSSCLHPCCCWDWDSDGTESSPAQETGIRSDITYARMVKPTRNLILNFVKEFYHSLHHKHTINKFKTSNFIAPHWFQERMYRRQTLVVHHDDLPLIITTIARTRHEPIAKTPSMGRMEIYRRRRCRTRLYSGRV